LKKIILIVTILNLFQGKSLAQKGSNNDSTIILVKDIYNNFPSSSQNLNSPITFSTDQAVLGKN
jgi:hypothetical protein